MLGCGEDCYWGVPSLLDVRYQIHHGRSFEKVIFIFLHRFVDFMNDLIEAGKRCIQNPSSH